MGFEVSADAYGRFMGRFSERLAGRLRKLNPESARWLELIRMHPEVARMVRAHSARS